MNLKFDAGTVIKYDGGKIQAGKEELIKHSKELHKQLISIVGGIKTYGTDVVVSTSRLQELHNEYSSNKKIDPFIITFLYKKGYIKDIVEFEYDDIKDNLLILDKGLIECDIDQYDFVVGMSGIYDLHKYIYDNEGAKAINLKLEKKEDGNV